MVSLCANISPTTPLYYWLMQMDRRTLGKMQTTLVKVAKRTLVDQTVAMRMKSKLQRALLNLLQWTAGIPASHFVRESKGPHAYAMC